MAEQDVKRPDMDEQAPGEQAAGESAAQAEAEADSAKKGGKKAKTSGKDAAKIASLEEKLAAAEAEKAKLNDNLLRTAAEYDNFRRRSKAEHDAAFSGGISKAVIEMLPVMDTLEVAANAETTDEEYKKGVLLTLQKCADIFKKLGIVEIDAAGKPFDPELHNACMQDADSGCESGICTKVIQKGYKMGDRVVRHAMVAVAP
ncbi:nucleotide exchange factor GrpE [Ruminococcaceae bacterium OttesenSCG-928-D13]|nr:nucleotide exchange factor GrpE [Ruminococcaceae bacterium OttesenSCG-928-D13]